MQDAKHHKDESGSRKDRSDDIEFRSGTPYSGIIDATAEHHDQDHNQGLQDERRAPADRSGNDAPDQRSRCGPDSARCTDDAKRSGTCGQVKKGDRAQNIDGWDQQSSANAFQQRIAKRQDAYTRGEGRDQRSQAVYGEAEH